jgi:hypothetical protein
MVLYSILAPMIKTLALLSALVVPVILANAAPLDSDSSAFDQEEAIKLAMSSTLSNIDMIILRLHINFGKRIVSDERRAGTSAPVWFENGIQFRM